MHAKKCCFIFSLRTGIFLGAAYLFIQFVADVTLGVLTTEKSDDERAIIAIDLSLMFLCSVMLAVAAWQADRLCLFLFIIFASTAFIIKICMESIYYAVHGEIVSSPMGMYRIAYEIVNAVADLYLMFIAVCYALEIKEHHTEEYYHYGHGDLSGGVSRVLYGY